MSLRETMRACLPGACIQPSLSPFAGDGGGGGPVEAVWDATMLSANAAIDETKLILSNTSGTFNPAHARATVGRSTGKWAFEVIGSVLYLSQGYNDACWTTATSPYVYGQYVSNNAYQGVADAIFMTPRSGTTGAIGGWISPTSLSSNGLSFDLLDNPLTEWLQVRLNLDDGLIEFASTKGSINKTFASVGIASGQTWYPHVSVRNTHVATANFGASPAQISLPAGYLMADGSDGT